MAQRRASQGQQSPRKTANGSKSQNGGTTKPVPTDKGDEASKEASQRASELAKKQNKAKELSDAELDAAIKEAQERLAKVKEEKKRLREEAAAKKKAEKELALAERKKKADAIEAAQKRVKEAEEALQATEEWAELKTAKEELAKIGPLPKVRSGGGARRTRAAGDLNGSEIRAMAAIRDAGKSLTRSELATLTGQTKGWSKLLGTKEGGNGGLCDRNLLNLIEHEEGPMQYDLTSEGRAALEKAEAEAKD